MLSSPPFTLLPSINVLLFASYAEAFGTHSLEIEVAEGSRVRDVLDVVMTRAPGALPDKPLVAVNEEYASLDRLIEPTDEVAIIPPVAGG